MVQWLAALLLLSLASPARASSGDTFEAGDSALTPIPMEPDKAIATPVLESPAAARDDSPPAEAPAPQAAQNPTPPAPIAPAAPQDDVDAILDSPTQSFEAYEKARLDRLYQIAVPHWSMNLAIVPRAFKGADLRVGSGLASLEENPSLIGVLLSYERIFLNQVGVLSGGLELGTYGSTTQGKFSGLLPGFLSAGPYVHYELNVLHQQWVVPAARGEFEMVRYSYTFNGHRARDVRFLPRLDVGLLVFLNMLDKKAAGEMAAGYGVKRTYAGLYYSVALDSTKNDFDLTDRSFRIVLRFEH